MLIIGEETLAKHETVEFCDKFNYTVAKKLDGDYVCKVVSANYLGAKYYTEKDVLAICRELNN